MNWILQGAQMAEELREALAAFSPVEPLVFPSTLIGSPLFKECTKVKEFAELCFAGHKLFYFLLDGLLSTVAVVCNYTDGRIAAEELFQPLEDLLLCFRQLLIRGINNEADSVNRINPVLQEGLDPLSDSLLHDTCVCVRLEGWRVNHCQREAQSVVVELVGSEVLAVIVHGQSEPEVIFNVDTVDEVD